MTDFEINSNDDDFGLEKMAYSRFYSAHVVRRQAQAPGKFEQWSTLQLPNNSVLHTVNGFDSLTPKDNGLPDINLPLVTNEKLPVYLSVHLDPTDKLGTPFGVDETYLYRKNTVLPGVAHLFQSHRKLHRIFSQKTIGMMPSVLAWVDYSPLTELRASGLLNEYRKFDIIFRTILNNIVTIGSDKFHYIVFPQSGNVFSKSALLRTFKELSTSTLNTLESDPSVFPLIHLLGWVFGETAELNVVPYKGDIKVYGKDNPRFKDLKSTSLLDRLDPSILSSVNFIFQKDDRAVIYNLADVLDFSKTPGFYQKLYRHLMMLRLTENTVPDHIDPDSEQFDTLVSTISGETPEETITPIIKTVSPTIPEIVPGKVYESVNKNVTVKEPVISKKSDIVVHTENELTQNSTFEEKIRSVVKTTTDTSFNMDPKSKTKQALLLDNHFRATLGGKALGELLQDPEITTIVSKDITSLRSTPEASYRKSSLLALDKAYQTYGQKHDMAKVIGSLAKHGLYVTKIDEEFVRTEMDRTDTYKVHLTDADGRSHHVKFTIPHVDDDGNMKLSGTEYRLTRQIANIPICKISPTRVNLSSYYNKVIVERVQSKRHSYEQDLSKLLLNLKSEGLITTSTGTSSLPTKPAPYDFSAIGRNFTELGINEYKFFFDGDGPELDKFNFDRQDQIKIASGKYGIPVGYRDPGGVIYWDMANQIHEVHSGKDEIVNTWDSFTKFLVDQLGDVASLGKTTSEWVQAKTINQNIPVVFILGYKFGLKDTLDRIKLSYKFFPTGVRPTVGIDDISIRFSDGHLVFNRYPIDKSLIAGGLNWVDLKNISFRDMILPDTYIRVLEKKGMSVGVLKGLTGLYEYFVDPKTEQVLKQMGEPTTFGGLLLRAVIMLSDYNSEEASSVALHRFRLYERFNGFIYNEIFRSLANYRNNPTNRKAFSINPEAVFQKIVQDATIAPNDTINPIHEIKQRTNFTFTGAGGRSSDSLVLRDRTYPKDGLGVISDAVPDSGKVGITAYLSASPNIDDIHGIPKPYKEGDALESPQILSIGSMVMPGGTTDDGKRNAYLSIQISHYVPNHDEGETLAVRTGYDEVVPHLSSNTFAIIAEDDGVVESIDTKHKVIKVRYADKVVPTIGTLKLPYMDHVVNDYRISDKPLGFLVSEDDIGKYPIGGIFGLTKITNGRISDRLRCENVDAIPDKDAVRRQNTLVQDLIRGKHKALYYIRFQPVSYKASGNIETYSFADTHSPVSGAYLLQKRVPNFEVGDKFKLGDVLVYNPGFFVKDPRSKQVTFKHGVLANVALIEKSSNLEDACEISREFSQKLKMTPCHQREIITKNDAAILKMVKIGDHVETSDALCIISDEYLVQSSGYSDLENLDLMEKLNRQTPSAGYTGNISKIRILYGGNRENLSESLREILKVYEKEVKDNFKALNFNPGASPPEKPGWVKPGTKYKGIDFAEDTVVLEFMIEESLDVLEGDKICISNAAKSIVSYVTEKQHFTESGVPIDILFSTTSIVNRIINSPFMVGLAERNMDALKEDILKMYFDE